MTLKITPSFSPFTLALTYIVGFLCMIFVFKDLSTTTNEIQYLVNHTIGLQLWYFCIYIVFGFLLIPLTIQIKNQFKQQNLLIQVTPILGFIWSGFVIVSGMIFILGTTYLSNNINTDAQQLTTIWATLKILIEAFGGGVEIVGGLWSLLVSIAGFQQKVFSKLLNIIGFLVGISGIITIIPILKDFGVIFGLMQIVWFVLLGFYFFKNRDENYL